MLEVAIHEGRKRIVRRMFEAVGHPRDRAGADRVSARCELGRLRAERPRRLRPHELEQVRVRPASGRDCKNPRP